MISEDLIKAGHVWQSERHFETEPAGLEFPAADVKERPPSIPVLVALPLTSPPL